MEYFSGDSEDDMSDSEIKDCEEKCYSELLKGVHLIRNKDGTLRCPFCKGKKKQDYKYKDLLQHASGVGAGKRGVEATGGHRALEKFLKSHLTDAAEPPIQRTVHLEQEAPQRPNAEELIVWPWMGIIVNINRTMVDGKYVGAGNSELKERFAGFHPIQVHALWSYEGHLGKAILEFSKDWKGYNDAISFERSFVENHHSRKEYYGRDPGSELYGWVARSEDYNATSPIGKHLRLKGDLKTVAQINNEDLRKKNKLVEDLHNTIQEKNKYLETSKEKLSKLEYYIVLTDSARQKAEENYRRLEETHREELNKFQQEIHALINHRNEENRQLNRDLERQMLELEQRRKELDQREAQNDFEKKKLEEEKKKVYNKKEGLQRANEIQKQNEQKQLKLIELHEKQNRELSIQVHQQRKVLADRQKKELDIQRLKAHIETLKEVRDGSNSDHIKKIETLESELQEKNDEMESLQDMNQQLMCKEREVNDELQLARKAAIEILNEGVPANSQIVVKRMGDLDPEAWRGACQRKFASNEWQTKYAEMHSLWEDYLRDPSWYPFKVVPVLGDTEKHELVVNEDDEKLRDLRIEMGKEVCDTVIVALKELNEYNASGRYPIPEAWNKAENRRATMKEIVLYLSRTKAKKRKTRA